MPALFRNCSVVAGLLACLLSVIALVINDIYYHYPGNDYFPVSVLQAGIYLLVILLSIQFTFGKQNYIYQLVFSIFSLFLVMAAIALLTNGVQFTPFKPIDGYLIEFEAFFHIDMVSIVAWTASYPWLKTILDMIYNSLPYQMTIFPLALAFLRHKNKLHEYFCLMLLSTLLGFVFYYFFPTVAPASMVNSPFFSLEQHATGLKFMQIHNHIPPTTMDGGMIALPSYHVIWAWFCLFSVRHWIKIFVISLTVFNFLLATSCVLLGWHYPVDLIGSLIVILATHKIHNFLWSKKNRVS